MTEIGEAVAVVIPGMLPAAAEESHDCATVEIVSITDANGTSIEGGKEKYDPRRYAVVDDKSTTITYKIENQGARVFLWIIPDSGNSIAMDYYPTPVVFTSYEVVGEGEHEMEWDGRGRARGKRFIIHGDYKVEISAKCMKCGKKAKHETTITVKPPYAYTYGAEHHDYWEETEQKWCPTCRRVRAESNITSNKCNVCDTYVRTRYKYEKEPESNTKGAENWRKRLDDVGFKVTKATTHSASEALTEMRTKSAVWAFDGHANEQWLDFMPRGHETAIVTRPKAAEGVRYWCDCHQRKEVDGDVKFTFKEEGKIMKKSDLEFLNKLPARALDDVFLLILMGCNTGASGGLALHQVLRRKGADLVLGFIPDIYGVKLYARWLKGFMDELEDGKGIRDAATAAVTYVPRNLQKYSKGERKEKRKEEKEFIAVYRMFRVYAGKGTNPNAKLLPMRYGRKKPRRKGP